jgi:hypothetical protein
MITDGNGLSLIDTDGQYWIIMDMNLCTFHCDGGGNWLSSGNLGVTHGMQSHQTIYTSGIMLPGCSRVSNAKSVLSHWK